MELIQRKQLISDLVRRCIGQRTLDEVCAATGLSRNRLHRLRNGDFTRMPSDDVIRALTAENANPQNGVAYSDFIAIIKNEQNNDGKTSEYAKKSIVSKDRIDCIIWKWLLSFGDVTIYKKENDAIRFDLIASVDNKKYFFEYKMVLSSPASKSFLERISMELITRIATCPIEKNSLFVVVTNSEQLSDIMRATSLNVASKVMLIQVNIEDNCVITADDLN